MADESDPPRKFYDLKPREFERVNASALPQPPPPIPSATPTAPVFDPSLPIKLNEVIAAANTPGRALPKTERAITEVHAVLAENAARETAAGLNDVKPRAEWRGRRRRDYVQTMLIVNFPLLLLGIYGMDTRNAMLAVCSFGGAGLFSAGFTWITWVVLDKY